MIRSLSKNQQTVARALELQSQVTVNSDGSAAPALLWLDFWRACASKYLLCAHGHAPSSWPSPIHMPSGPTTSPAPGHDARTGYLPAPAASPTLVVRPRQAALLALGARFKLPRQRLRAAASLAPPREISRRQEEE